MAPNAARRKQHPGSIPSGLHAGEPDVMPCDIRRSKTSSAVSDAPAKNAHSSRAENSRFFQKDPPPDGPRRPLPVAWPLPAASGHALGSGRIAGAEAPSPARWPDNAQLPADATRCGLLPRTLRCSTARVDERERTTSRTPSTDTSAHERRRGLAVASKRNHAESWTHGASTPEGQAPAAEPRLRSGAFGTVTSCLSTLRPA